MKALASSFPALPITTTSGEKPIRLSVCIVSPEFAGPSTNGGIGTAYTAMADALVAAGHEVVCLFAKAADCGARHMAEWTEKFRARGVQLVALPLSKVPIDGLYYSTRSYEAYNWLKANDRFDVIHFPEWQALGYHTQVAKRQGLAFGRACICIGTHSMTDWLKTANHEYFADHNELQLDHMERQSVALADVLVSPSRYLLEWISGRGWTLPEASYVQQNIMPLSATRPANAVTRGTRRISELVFFGRLETRKGVQLFCDALDRLAARGAAPARVTFLGKEATVAGMTGEAYVRKRAENWRWQVQLLKDYDQVKAMEYLRGEGRLAVVSSLVENSPYTVLECLGADIAFVASRVGGIPELIAAEDVETVCFDLKPDALAARLESVLLNGFKTARPSVDATATKQQWVAWHEACGRAERSKPLQAERSEWPKISLCLTTYNRPAFLRQALESIRALTYPALEVVLVDDGSTQPDAIAILDEIAPEFALRGWQIVRQPNRYLGAARNTGARHATSDYLLFMDDDNYAEPTEVGTLVRAMLGSGADIVCCGMNYFSGQTAPDRKAPPKGRWLPTGGSASAGAFANCFGDANALVRRSCFEAVGGFTEDYGVTHEDWEFHARAVLKGFRLEVVPEFLFWYRANEGSMIRTLAPYPNYARSLRPYLDAVPPALHGLVRYAQGASRSPGPAGNSAGWTHYIQLTVQWRSKLEAGLALEEAGQLPAAAKLMLAGIKAVETCKQPQIILEAILEICRHLGRIDPGRAKFLLGMGVNLAETMRRSEDKARAEKMIAALSVNSVSPVRREGARIAA